MDERNIEEKGDGLDKEPGASYETLKQEEALPPNPKEIISFPGLSKTSPEFLRLQKAGIDMEKLEEGGITREQLLGAGFVFINKIGGGEKSIISAEISLPEQGNIDLSNRVLLTQMELGTVIKQQSQYPEQFGAGGQNFDAVRQDMLIFLEQSMAEQNNLKQRSIEAFKAAQRRIMDNNKYLDSDRRSLEKFFQGLSQKPDAGITLGYIMESCLQGIDLIKVRGIPVEIVLARISALNGAPSPFLDSGYHFDKNYDVTMYPNDPEKTKRLNMVVVHLLSRGLNEMGGSNNKSHDQKYTTSGDYASEVKSLPNEPTPEISEENLDLIAARLLVRIRRS